MEVVEFANGILPFCGMIVQQLLLMLLLQFLFVLWMTLLLLQIIVLGGIAGAHRTGAGDYS